LPERWKGSLFSMLSRIGLCVVLKIFFVLQANGIAGYGDLNLFS
jgi:hypothetical protein